MAVRKNAKAQAQTVLQEVSADSDLSLRLEKISEQTGLSPQSLLQKWILQEETLIGLMQGDKEPSSGQPSANADTILPKKDAAQKQRGKIVPLDPGSPGDYKKKLVKRLKQLKNKGISLSKIAETLNEEKAPTLSGTGEWYANSVSRLLKSK